MVQNQLWLPEINCKNIITVFKVLQDGILVTLCFTTYNCK